MKKRVTVNTDDISNLSRLALTGRRQDIQLFIRRMATRIRDLSPDLYSNLNSLLHETPTPSSPYRNEALASIPVDHDSRLGLVRFEHPVALDIEPIWAAEIEENLNQIIAERSKIKELFKEGLAPSSSMLFTGKPGVGKTLAAKWLAAKLKMPLLTLDLSAVMSSFLGKTGSNVRNVFDYAKGSSCVLLLDELDSIAKKRDDISEIGELKRLVTVLLQEIDDWPTDSLLIAATNHSELLDHAVWRRFDIIQEFPMPNKEQILQAIDLYLGNHTNSKLRHLLAITLADHSFSDIEREVLKLRRSSIANDKPLKDSLGIWIKSKIETLDWESKKKLAVDIVNAGFTQSKAHELTLISRPTIRKSLKE